MLTIREQAEMVVRLADASGVSFQYDNLKLDAASALQNEEITRAILKVGLFSLGIKSIAELSGSEAAKASKAKGPIVPAALIGLAIDYAFEAAPKFRKTKTIDVDKLLKEPVRIEKIDGRILIADELIHEIRDLSTSHSLEATLTASTAVAQATGS